MNEYLYLSDDKLRKFLPDDDRQWWRRLRVRKTVASVGAGVAKLDVELEHRGSDRLTEDKLRWVVEQIDERCPWYEQPVSAGDWVMYEGRLGCRVVTAGPAAGAVVFYDVDRPPGARRTLLHGSARHVLGAAAGQRTAGGQAAERPVGGFSTMETVPVSVRGAVEAMTAPADPGPWTALARLLGARSGVPATYELDDQVAALFATVDGSTWYTGTAPYVVAIVKVTAVLPARVGVFETLVGSPLFVRSVRP